MDEWTHLDQSDLDGEDASWVRAHLTPKACRVITAAERLSGRWRPKKRKRQKTTTDYTKEEYRAAVKKHGPVKPHKPTKGKRSAVEPEWWDNFVKKNPYSYHLHVGDAHDEIAENGILPYGQLSREVRDNGYGGVINHPRMNHGYAALPNNKYEPKNSGAHTMFKVDNSMLSHDNIDLDEDWLPATTGLHHTVNPDHECGCGKPNCNGGRGGYCDSHPEVDAHENVIKSIKRNGTFAVRGGIPANALSIHDQSEGDEEDADCEEYEYETEENYSTFRITSVDDAISLATELAKGGENFVASEEYEYDESDCTATNMAGEKVYAFAQEIYENLVEKIKEDVAGVKRNILLIAEGIFVGCRMSDQFGLQDDSLRDIIQLLGTYNEPEIEPRESNNPAGAIYQLLTEFENSITTPPVSPYSYDSYGELFGTGFTSAFAPWTHGAPELKKGAEITVAGIPTIIKGVEHKGGHQDGYTYSIRAANGEESKDLGYALGSSTGHVYGQWSYAQLRNAERAPDPELQEGSKLQLGDIPLVVNGILLWGKATKSWKYRILPDNWPSDQKVSYGTTSEWNEQVKQALGENYWENYQFSLQELLDHGVTLAPQIVTAAWKRVSEWSETALGENQPDHSIDPEAWEQHVGGANGELPEDTSVTGWQPVSSHRTARRVEARKRITANWDVIQSHLTRLAYVRLAAKIDKLADKAREQFFTRPDVAKWIDQYPNAENRLREFVAHMPNTAYKSLPWMWLQIKRNPESLYDDYANFTKNLYDVGKAIHVLRSNNQPAPDINQMDYSKGLTWLGDVKPVLDKYQPMPWKDPKEVHKLSDGKHVIHQITNAEDATQEGEEMAHCVGSYGHQIENGDTNIYSVRDELHRPHATIELKPDGGGSKTDFGYRNGDQVTAVFYAEGYDNPIKGIITDPPGSDHDPYKLVKILESYRPEDVGKTVRLHVDHDFITKMDGTKPERTTTKTDPPGYRVTQVFGKTDSAPIAKYRKMVREFFDKLRSESVNLTWAGNEFLPEQITSMSDAEELYAFLDGMQDELDEREDNGEHQTEDALSVARAMSEAGSMAAQYGFEVNPESMQVNWDDLISDFVENAAISGDYDAEEAAKWIEAVAEVKGMDRETVRRALNNAQGLVEDDRNERESEQRSSDMERNWFDISEHAEELLRDKIEAALPGHTIDHDSEEAYAPDEHDEDGDPDFAHQEAAQDRYYSANQNHEDEAQYQADDEWNENWEPHDAEYPASDALNELESTLLSNPNQSIINLVDEAMNPKVDDRTVNMRWKAALSTLAKSPKFYGKKSQDFKAMLGRMAQTAEIEIAKKHNTLGWQRDLKGNEVALRDTSERTDHLMEALKRLVDVSDADKGPSFTQSSGDANGDTHRSNQMNEYLQQHSLHEPFGNGQSQTPRTDNIRQQWERSPQRDITDEVIDQHGGFVDSQGSDLSEGMSVTNAQGFSGTVGPINAQGYLTIEYRPGSVLYFTPSQAKSFTVSQPVTSAWHEVKADHPKVSSIGTKTAGASGDTPEGLTAEVSQEDDFTGAAPDLDILIKEFEETGSYSNTYDGDDSPVSDNREWNFAVDQCSRTSHAFVDFLKANGVDSQIQWIGEDHREHPDFDSYGYADRDREMPDGDPSSKQHCIVQVTRPSGTFTVDFTPAQYGYSEFPLVQRQSETGWDRDWHPSALPTQSSWQRIADLDGWPESTTFGEIKHLYHTPEWGDLGFLLDDPTPLVLRSAKLDDVLGGYAPMSGEKMDFLEMDEGSTYYADLDANLRDAPPLILDHLHDGSLIARDGNHRIALARHAGVEYMPAYVSTQEGRTRHEPSWHLVRSNPAIRNSQIVASSATETQSPESWKTAESNPLLNTSGPLDAPENKWVYVNGQVAVAQTIYDATRKVCEQAGLDDQTTERIENTITRHQVPQEVQIAVGIINARGRPEFWVANTDRNKVYDAVMESQTGDLTRTAAYHNDLAAQATKIAGYGTATNQGMLAGDAYDNYRQAGLKATHKHIHCSAACREGHQSVAGHGMIDMLIDNNGLTEDQMSQIIEKSGIPIQSIEPATGVGNDGESSTFYAPSTRVVLNADDTSAMHAYLKEHVPKFGCAALASDQDGTNGFDAAGYQAVSATNPCYHFQCPLHGHLSPYRQGTGH